MKKLIILCMLCTLLVISFTSAQDTSFGTYPQNKPLELLQVCSNATSLCDFCNITTVNYPDSTIIVSNVEMTKRDYDFNYSLLATQTDQLGIYLVQGFCVSGGEYEVFSYDFEITTRGDSLSTSQGIIYLIFLIAVFGIFILVTYIAFKIPTKHGRNQEGRIISVNDLKWVKTLMFVLSYLLLMWTFGILRSISESYLVLAGAYKLFHYLFWFMFALVWPIIVLSFVFIILSFVESKKLKKMIDRGIPVR